MPSVNLRPSAVGAFDTWTLAAGASKTAAVDPQSPISHDDYTSYITGNVNINQSFYMATDKPSAIGVVNSLGASIRHLGDWADGFTTVQWGARLGTTNGALGSDTRGGTIWINQATASVGRPGGGSWGPYDIYDSSLQLVINSGNGGTGSYVTSVWMPLDYTPAPGGYLTLVSSLVGAAVGLQELHRLAHAAFALTHVRIRPHEYLDLWSELRYQPRRAYSL